MKFMFIGDLQSHAWKNYPETDEKGVNLRLLDTSNELNRLCKLAVRNSVECVFVLGDIFEARNTLDITVLNQVYRAFMTFKESNIRVILLVGNHDRTGVGNEHALEVFKPFCEVVDIPTTFPFIGGDVVAIPFHPNPKVISRAIKETVTEETKILLLHCAVKSLVMPNGRLWGDGISLEDIPKHVICLLGHYHKYAELRTGKVYYLGSMIQVDKSDAGNPKYFVVYDSSVKDRPLRFFQTKGPKFVAIDIDRPTAGYYESLEPLVAGNFVTVKSLPNGFNDTSAVIDSLKKVGARHVDIAVQTQFPSIMPPELSDTESNLAPVEAVEEYVEQSETNLDKDILTDVGVRIVQTVSRTVDSGDKDIDAAFNEMIAQDV